MIRTYNDLQAENPMESDPIRHLLNFTGDRRTVIGPGGNFQIPTRKDHVPDSLTRRSAAAATVIISKYECHQNGRLVHLTEEKFLVEQFTSKTMCMR